MTTFERPNKAYIVELNNGNKMALTNDASGNIVCLYGKYETPEKFRVVEIKHYNSKVPTYAGDASKAFEDKAYVDSICQALGSGLNQKKKIRV
jgi:hypothetical protein